jgi:hypothetical protein
VLSSLIGLFTTEHLTIAIVAPQAFLFALVAWLFFYCQNTPIIEYDYLEEKLQVRKRKSDQIEVIPVQNITKILYSSFGLSTRYSYVIVYQNQGQEQSQIRVFPIPFQKDIEQLQLDTKAKNPDVVISNWSVGWNEFFK